MAVYSIADMGASFSTVYRRKISQTQRKCPLLRVLAQVGNLQPGNTGQAMTWTPKFSGQVAGNPSLDGGAFLAPASDQPVAASLNYGVYEAPSQITDAMLRLGGVGAGIIAEYNTFADPINEARIDAVQAALKLAEQQLFIGSGTANQMAGFSSSIAASGTYAGISASSFPQWASTVIANGGTNRSLTLGLMKQTARTIAVASKAGRPNLIVTTPALMDAVEALFDANLFLPQMSGPTPMVPPGAERLVVNPGEIRTMGGNINMDGFRHFYWATAGLYFVEAPDCTNNAQSNAANVMYFLNTNELGVDYIRPVGPRITAPDSRAVPAIEQDMGALASLEFEEIGRGRVVHAATFDVTCQLGLKLLSRNAHGVLADVQ